MILDAATFSSIWSALGMTVVHFLWQGALIGLCTLVALSCLRHRSSAARYAVASGAMLLCLLSFVATFIAALAGTLSPVGEGVRQVALAGGGSVTYLPLGLGAAGVASWCWAVGVLCMALRFALQCYGAQRLKNTAVSAPDASWQRAFQSLKEELGVTRTVRLLRSGLAEVPMVVGWFSPIILVPVSAFTALSPDQLRSLLAHELAHIRRHDHLLNAAQAVVEIVLFFHPVVWWISKQVRLEREYCCDDSSVRLTGNPRLLAEALAALETLRIHQPLTQPVLAANGGPLMQRITRILGERRDGGARRDGGTRRDGRTSPASWHLPAGFVLAGLLAVAGNAYATPTLIVDGDATLQDDLGPQGRKVWAELEAMVDAGKMAEAQAKERFAAWKRKIAEKNKPETKQRDRVNPKKVWAELEAAVKAGRITEEQARERFADLQKRLDAQKDNSAAAQRVKAELEAAVEAGKLTDEQAKAKFAELRQSLADRETVQKRADPEAVIKRIALAVETGRLTPEQGKERIEAYKKNLAEQKAAKSKELEGMIRRIKGAVESGRMTAEEGEAAIREYKQRQAGSLLTRRKENPEAVIKEIRAAVKAAGGTPEQAEERIKAYKESLSEKKSKQKRKKKPEKKVEEK